MHWPGAPGDYIELFNKGAKACTLDGFNVDDGGDPKTFSAQATIGAGQCVDGAGCSLQHTAPRIEIVLDRPSGVI